MQRRNVRFLLVCFYDLEANQYVCLWKMQSSPMMLLMNTFSARVFNLEKCTLQEQLFETPFKPFIKTPLYSEVVRVINRSLAAPAVRNIQFPVLQGFMGCGKTRTASEACLEVQRIANENKTMNVKLGYIPNAESLLRSAATALADDLKDLAFVRSCLAHALLVSFRQKVFEERSSVPKLADVIDRFKQSFGEDVRVLLHVDEYSGNVRGVQCLLKGCSLAFEQYGFRVVIVASGMRPLSDLRDDLQPGSRFTLAVVVAPAIDTESDDFKKMVRDYLGLAANVQPGRNFQTLVSCTRGYAASMVELLESVRSELSKAPEKIKHFRKTGILEIEDARKIFEIVVENIEPRYCEQRWLRLSRDTGRASIVEMEAVRNALRTIMLNCLTDADVDPTTVIFSGATKKWTYDELEQGGLLQLERKEDRIVIVVPLLALIVMNKFIPVMHESLTDPFDHGFSALEHLALASMHIRVVRFQDQRIKTFTLEQLRPGAKIIGDDVRSLSINVPKEARFVIAGTKIEKNASQLVSVRSGVRDDGFEIQPEAGTFMITAEGQEAVDGVALFSGKLGEKEVPVMILSQSKSLHVKSDVETHAMQTSDLQACIEKMKSFENNFVIGWLGHAAKGDIVIVYDIFTNKNMGPKSYVPKITDENRILVVTTKSSIATALGVLYPIGLLCEKCQVERRSQGLQ